MNRVDTIINNLKIQECEGCEGMGLSFDNNQIIYCPNCLKIQSNQLLIDNIHLSERAEIRKWIKEWLDAYPEDIFTSQTGKSVRTLFKNQLNDFDSVFPLRDGEEKK